MKKRIIAIVLCVAMLCSATALPTLAASEYSSSEQSLYTIGEKALQGIVGLIAGMIKAPNSWKNESEYTEKTYKPNEFIDEAAEDAVWKVGYGSGSLQTGDELSCYVGGSLAVTKKLATKVCDDQRVRTVAMSDGRGITVFASVDTFGLANSEVEKIRAMMAEYCAEKGINSINISALHQHSCIDTFGMNGDLIGALFMSPIRNILGIENPSGQSPAFMENFYKVVIASIKEAVENMQEGRLTYGSTDISKYIRDKRDPQVFDPNMNVFKFTPANDGKETYIVNMAIHCVGMGAAGTTVTGDYPYYMEQVLKEKKNANFMMIQGAELAISSRYDTDPETNAALVDPDYVEEYGTRYAGMVKFGKTLGNILCDVDCNQVVEPILNYATKTYTCEANNNILVLAAKGGLLTNTIVRSGIGKYSVVTELGYVELGKGFAIAIVPGELAPEIAFGGATTAEDSWQGEAWNYPAIKDKVGGRKLLVFGMTNDQIGYMLTDNSWHSFLCENEEIVTAGDKAGSTFIEAFYGLINNL